ncbi:hypothetical protein ACFLYK_00405 [Candidatus Cloacimonadota bacterium]
MAILKISLTELAEFLVDQKITQKYISDLQVEGDHFQFNFITGKLFPKSFPLSIKFLSFTDKRILFEISTSSLAGSLLKFLPSKNNEYYSLDFPDLYINIQVLSKKFLMGMEISDIKYNDGEFSITFSSSSII